MIDPESSAFGWAIRTLGALIGVIASIIIVAPEGTKNTLYRIWVGITMGAIFAPVIPNIRLLAFFAGDGVDLALARAAFTGFAVWFVLELTARLLSSSTWGDKLINELIRLRGGPKP